MRPLAGPERSDAIGCGVGLPGGISVCAACGADHAGDGGIGGAGGGGAGGVDAGKEGFAGLRSDPGDGEPHGVAAGVGEDSAGLAVGAGPGACAGAPAKGVIGAGVIGGRGVEFAEGLRADAE